MFRFLTSVELILGGAKGRRDIFPRHLDSTQNLGAFLCVAVSLCNFLDFEPQICSSIFSPSEISSHYFFAPYCCAFRFVV